ncbi:MAG: hypothetical protein Q9168_005776, partial [Polycauliona sp. 1 TL-2023]
MASTTHPSAAASATVRFATEADVPTILSLIHELAAYEKASSAVLATESSLLNTLSFPSSSSSSASAANPSGFARTLLIYPAPSSDDNGNKNEEGKECAGLALYFHNYSTWRAAP